MDIRRASIEDIENIINNRIEFLSLIGDFGDEENLRKALKKYLYNYIKDGKVIIYIGTVDNKIVSSAILSVYKKIPTYACLTGKMAILSNVYTLEEYRKRGYSRKILKELFACAKNEGVKKVQLDYTEDGYELYRELGFKCSNRKMEMLL